VTKNGLSFDLYALKNLFIGLKFLIIGLIIIMPYPAMQSTFVFNKSKQNGNKNENNISLRFSLNNAVGASSWTIENKENRQYE
jgi:hypothetical protein